MTDSSPEPRKYNDAHLMGWAYVNEVRFINQKGNPYYSASLAVIQGEVDKPTYLRIRSCNAHGVQATGMAAALHELLVAAYNGQTRPGKGQSELKIRARFKASDLESKPYLDREKEKQFRLHCRLFELTHVYVDGERTFSELDVIDMALAAPPLIGTPVAVRTAPPRATTVAPVNAPPTNLAVPSWGVQDGNSATLVSYDVNIAV